METIQDNSNQIQDKVPVKGYDFNNGHSIDSLIKTFGNFGLQASLVHEAICILNEIIDIRVKSQSKCKIILGFTSNMISCGLREFIKFLCEHKFVDALVTTTGAVEEDCMKCWADTYVNEFICDDRALRKEGLNRIGNTIISNDNYCTYEDFFMPLLEKMHEKQDKEGIIYTPSKDINYLGENINHKDSCWYWCHKNNIPVYSPALTDGAIGDMMFFYSYKKPGFILNINQDYTDLCDFYADCEPGTTKAAIIFGGGTIKHHVLNPARHSGGLDYAVVVCVSENFDGSEAGALLVDEQNKGKLAKKSRYVKVNGEGSLVAPILIAETFGKRKDE